jgi:hypothetical protein
LLCDLNCIWKYVCVCSPLSARLPKPKK